MWGGVLSSLPCCPLPALRPALGGGGGCLENAPPTPYVPYFLGWGPQVIYFFYSLSNSQK